MTIDCYYYDLELLTNKSDQFQEDVGKGEMRGLD